MKTMKKLLAIFLAVLMLTALLPTVLAEDGGYTITITADYTQAEEHTFQAYKIFSGTLNSDGTKLSDVTWADGVNGESVISSLAASGATYADAQAVADALCTDTNNDGTNDLTVSTFKAAVASNLNTVAGTSTANKDADGNITSYTISNLTAGYYFVKESASMVGKNDAVTAYMLQVVNDVSVVSKTGVPTLEKHVKDNNDSAGSTTDWQDSADYDVGDIIPYKLEAKLNISADNYALYNSYSMKFTDSMCDGLTLVQSATGETNAVKVVKSSNGTETDITSASGVTITKADHSLVVEITDIKAADINAAYSDKIIVYYYATLNSNAVIGSTGNPNTAYLEFSNNPNVASEMGKTPEDKNIVFTYQVTVNKVDGDDNALEGAGFTLYKYNPNSEEEDKYDPVGSEQGGKDSTVTVFSWLRLDEGDYKLVETTTPDGYTKAADVTFTITARHTNDSDNNEGENPLSLISLSGGDTFTGTVSTGTLSGEVVNKPGDVLPSTGGVGTTMFYVVGSVLAIGAFILLVAKKRASRAN